jgi:hypothetical protein
MWRFFGVLLEIRQPHAGLLIWSRPSGPEVTSSTPLAPVIQIDVDAGAAWRSTTA